MRYRLLSRLAPLVAATALFTAALGTSDASSWVATKSRAFPVKASLINGHVPGATPLHVIVSLKLQHADELKTFIANQRRPGSPSYGVNLTPAQFTAAYSPTAAQSDAVASYMASQGFRNVKVTPNRLLVEADGSASAVEAAFNTRLTTFAYQGKQYFAPTQDVMVPATLGDVVLGVHGLNNVNRMLPATKARRHADELPGKVMPTAAGAPAIVQAYTADAIHKAYNVGDTPAGSGTVIAISTAGSDLQQVITDLRIYERDSNLPSVPVQVVQSAPLPNPQDNAGDGEWDLDSQSSTGMAGHAKQLVFYNATDLGDSLLKAYSDFATDNIAKAGNMSYGGCDVLQHFSDPTGDPLGLGLFADFVSAADQLFMQAVAQGQTWFASSGDAGAACGLITNMVTPDVPGIPSNVEYPASSPYVVAVGGTSLVTDSAYNYIVETAWDAGGGGFSFDEAPPAWQASVVPTAMAPTGLPPGGGRGVPDIAMVAGGPDVGTPVGFFGFGGADIVSNGAHGAAVGTSWSSPLAVGVWARLQSARCNQMGFAAPLLYGLDPSPGPGSTAVGFHDIILGNNGQYNATPGWDFTTGYGTFDVSATNKALQPGLKCTVVTTPPAASISASTQLGPAPLSVVISGVGSSDPTGGGLTNYSVDFGDGTTADQAAPVFPAHVYSQPGTYTATLRVTNANGAVSTLVSKTITAFGTPLACLAGGQTMLTSPPGAADAEQGIDLGNGTDDLRSMAISEPGDQNGKLVFTIKVANLTTVQPGFRWVTYFDVAGRNNPNTEYYYVAMSTANGPTPMFEYGIHSYAPGPQPLSLYTPTGTLTGSSYNADGTITLVLDKSVFGLKTGDVLTNLYTSTRLTTPTDNTTGTVPGGAGLTQDSAGANLPYLLVGNDTCAPNVAPEAKLTATPAAALVNQAVTLDASGSHDADAQDTVKYFNFDFGDGTQSGWQTASRMSHLYSVAGSYSPSVQVADSRGKLGTSPAAVTLAVTSTAPATGLVAQLAADTVNGFVPLVVKFDASGSKNKDGSAISAPSYTFVFGDGGQSKPQTSPVFVYTYTTAGTFQPYVIVTDGNNQSATSPTLSVTSTLSITVLGVPHGTVAQLTADITSGLAPLKVTFDGSRSLPADGASITTYTFDFGDNSPVVSGSSPTATHVYTVPGSYKPSLTVTDSAMGTSVAKAAVLIQGTSSDQGSSLAKRGGGAFGLLTLLPLMGIGLARRRRR